MMVFRLIALLALVAGFVWLLRRFTPSLQLSREPRRGYEFALEFLEGRRRRVTGVVPRTVCNAFDDVAAVARTTGWVAARSDGSLDFSDDIPDGARQQFRNAWWSGRET